MWVSLIAHSDIARHSWCIHLTDPIKPFWCIQNSFLKTFDPIQAHTIIPASKTQLERSPREVSLTLNDFTTGIFHHAFWRRSLITKPVRVLQRWLMSHPHKWICTKTNPQKMAIWYIYIWIYIMIFCICAKFSKGSFSKRCTRTSLAPKVWLAPFLEPPLICCQPEFDDSIFSPILRKPPTFF